MTGKELIIYILENNLENEDIFKDGKFIGFKSLAEVAEETGVGTETVRIWCLLNMIPYITINDCYLVQGNYKPPIDSSK